MILKTWKNDLTKVQGVVNNIKNINAWANGSTRLLTNKTVKSLSSEISGLNLKQSQLALSTKNLTKEQTKQVLVKAGLIASENHMQAELVQSALAQSGLSAEKQKDILNHLKLINTTTGEIIVTKACTKEKLLNTLASKKVTGANKEAIISTLGFSSANKKAALSSGLYAKAIWEQTKAQAALLAKNTMTWYVAAAGILLLNKKINDNIKSLKEQNELFEETENIISNYDSDIREKESNKNSNLEKINELKNNNNNIDNDKLTKLENENSLLEQQIQTLETLKEKEKELAEQITLDILNNTAEITKLTQVWEDLKNFDFGKALKDNNFSFGAVLNSKEMWEDGDYLGSAINLAKGAATTFIPIAEIIDLLIPKKENDQSITEETSEQIEKVKNLRNELSNLEKQKSSMSKKNYEKKHKKLTDNIYTETNELSDNIKYLQNYQSTLDTSDPIQLEKFKEIQYVMDDYTASMTQLDDYNTFDKIINSDIYGKDKEKLIELAKQGKLTEGVLDNNYHNLSVLFKALGYDIDDVTSKFIELGKKQQTTTDNDIPAPTSFTEAWTSLGKEANEDTAKSSNTLKERLLELANAGKLTEKTFNQTDGAKTWMEQMKNMGMTTEDVIKEINSLAENTKQLETMHNGIDTIKSAYTEKENSPDYTVSPKTLGNIYDTLGIENWDKKGTDTWEKYKKAATDGEKSMSGLKKEQNALATAYVNSNNFLSNLTDDTQDYYDALLTDMGITNAHKITTQALNATKINEAKAQDEVASILSESNKAKQLGITETDNLNNATISEIGGLITYGNQLGTTTTELHKFMNKKILAATQNAISDQDLTAIAQYCEYLGICSEEISLLKTSESNLKAVTTGIHAEPKTSTDLHNQNAAKTSYEENKDKLLKAAQKELEKKKENIGKIKISLDDNPDPDEPPKKSTQTIDWIERRLHSLQSTIDLTSAKLQNLFTVKDKNKNLSQQIKETKKLIAAYGTAAKQYQKKADSVDLSPSLKKLAREGKINGTPKELIKKYGEDTANNITEYQSWYDKSKDAEKNKYEQRAKKNELIKQKHQNIVDNAQANIDKLNARKDNTSNTEKKNKYLKQQLKWLKQSYSQQIKIAELEENNALKDKLKAEKQKALLDNKIEQYQNMADKHDAKKELLNAKIENSFSANAKNKLEKEKISAIKKNYDYQIKIAKAEGDSVKAATLLARKYAEILETKKNILQHTLDENTNNRTLFDAKYSNAKTTKEKNALIDDKIKSYESDKKAYENHKNTAKAELKSAKSKVSSILGVTTSKVSGLTKAEKTKIKNLMKKGKKIPDSLLNKVKHSTLLQRLNDYNAKVDAASDAEYTYELGNEQTDTAIRESETEKLQNHANDAEAEYNLNQQYENNANSAKDKNKYEADSRKNLKEQYKHLMAIAHLNHNFTEEKRLQAEQEAKIAESYKKEFDNIKTEYELKTGRIDSEIGVTQAEVSALEAQGKTIVAAFYDSMIKAEQSKKSELLAEKAELEKSLSNLTVGSADWYDAKNTLDGVSTALSECTQNTAEWQKTINELNMKPFQNAISYLQTEESHLEFLINMLSHEKLIDDDTGAFTSNGLAKMSLQFDEIANKEKQIANLRKQWSEYDFSNLSEEEIIAKNKEFQESIQSLIEGTAGLKDSIIDLCENALNTQLSSLNDLISKYKDALNAEEDLYQYQKKVKEQTETIASLMKQQAALKGDESEETRARLQQIDVKLKEAQENLEETEHQRTIDDINNMLDGLSEDFEKYISSVLSDTDELIERVEQAVKHNPQAIANALSDLGYGKATDTNIKENPDGSKEISISTSDGGFITNKFDMDGNYIGSTVTDKNGSVVKTNDAKSADSATNNNNTSIETNTDKSGGHSEGFNDKRGKIDTEIANLMYSGRTTAPLYKVSNKLNDYIKSKNGGMYITEQAWSQIKWILKEKYQLADVDKTPDNVIIETLKRAGFSQGGIVSSSDVNKVVSYNGDDRLITAKVGERVLTPVDSESFGRFNAMLPNTVNVMDNFINDNPIIQPLTPVKNGITLGNVSINLEGSNVVDFPSFKQEFENELRTDSSFKSMLGNAVTGMMVGEHVNRLGRF